MNWKDYSSRLKGLYERPSMALNENSIDKQLEYEGFRKEFLPKTNVKEDKGTTATNTLRSALMKPEWDMKAVLERLDQAAKNTVAETIKPADYHTQAINVPSDLQVDIGKTQAVPRQHSAKTTTVDLSDEPSEKAKTNINNNNKAFNPRDLANPASFQDIIQRARAFQDSRVTANNTSQTYTAGKQDPNEQ